MKHVCTLVLLLLAAVGTVAADDESPKIRVALITGGHGFEEAPFLAVFEGMKFIEFKHFVLDKDKGFLDKEDRDGWDVLVLYNMSPVISEEEQAALLETLRNGTSLVALHHSIAAYPAWPEWAEIIGAKYFLEAQTWQGEEWGKSEYTHGIEMLVHVEDPNHPITQGLADFVIHDEVYRKWKLYPGCHLLLSCDHPESDKAVCWTRDYKGAKVCFLQLGHGSEAYANPNFGILIERAIQWSAKNDAAGEGK